MLSRISIRVPAIGLLLLTCWACGGSESPTGPAPEAVFVIAACRGSSHAPGGELLRVLIRDPEVIAEAELLIGAGNVKIVGGRLQRGDGGFNQPWSWHLDPESVVFSDAAVEVCDGCPSFVEADLDYWVDSLGSYCPWSTEVVSRER